MRKLVILFLLSSFALTETLEEMVDNLSPDEARRVISKIQAKQYKGLISEGFFTKVSVGASGSIVFSDQDDFYGSVNSKHLSDSSSNKSMHNRMTILWKNKGNFRFGLGAGYMNQLHNEEITTDTFEEINLNSQYLHLHFAHVIPFSKKLKLIPSLGAGVGLGGAHIKTSNDDVTSSKWTYEFKYSGVGFSAQGALGLNYFFNEIISIGLDGGYHHLKVNDLKRNGLKKIASPSELDFSGAFVGLNFSYNI